MGAKWDFGRGSDRHRYSNNNIWANISPMSTRQLSADRLFHVEGGRCSNSHWKVRSWWDNGIQLGVVDCVAYCSQKTHALALKKYNSVTNAPINAYNIPFKSLWNFLHVRPINYVNQTSNWWEIEFHIIHRSLGVSSRHVRTSTTHNATKIQSWWLRWTISQQIMVGWTWINYMRKAKKQTIIFWNFENRIIIDEVIRDQRAMTYRWRTQEGKG